jgi:hypothetical protein
VTSAVISQQRAAQHVGSRPIAAPGIARVGTSDGHASRGVLGSCASSTKRDDEQLRCKSFLIELIVAHLWDNGWNGEHLAVTDYPRAFEQALSYIARTELRTPIAFSDFYPVSAVVSTRDPIQVWDPVNPANNVARSYTDSDRQKLVKTATTALEDIAWAAHAPTKGDATDAWRNLLGQSFQGA